MLPKFAECTPDKIQFWVLALFAILVPIIGGASAHFVHPALMAAREAIDELGKRWEGKWKERADLYHLPGLLGGGAKDADKNGHKHILNIVYCFMAVWLGVFYITCAFIVQSLTHTQLSGETLLQIQSVLVSFRWPKRELLLVVLIGGAFWICFIRRSLPKPTSKSKS